MKFISRLTCPSKDNKYYVNSNYNIYAYNYNMFKIGGNCTTYCYGRWAELLDKNPKLCPNQAENWWRYKDGYQRGQTPKLGAIAVWAKGNEYTYKDGSGHVAIVEEILYNQDGSINEITFSESGANTSSGSVKNNYLFKTKKMKPPYSKGGTYKFLGFIYLPLEFENEIKTELEEYTKGNYITLEEMNIRSGAGYKYSLKKVKDMSANGRKHATSTNLNSNAAYKKGTEFTAQEIIKNGNEVWAKSPSGYICLKGSSGRIYCKNK